MEIIRACDADSVLHNIQCGRFLGIFKDRQFSRSPVLAVHGGVVEQSVVLYEGFGWLTSKWL